MDETEREQAVAAARAAMRAEDRAYRAWLIGKGVLRPAVGVAAAHERALEGQIAALPYLPIDDAGKRSAARPIAVDRFGRVDFEAVNLGVAVRLAS